MFVDWIFQCTSTVSYAVLINGFPSTPFEAEKGLRQGSPLSPYLFVLAMEYFTRLLKQLRKSPNFKYHPRCAKMHLVQLSFADDLLLFGKGELTSVRQVYELFKVFSSASGLEANIDTSSIYFGGVSLDMQQAIRQELGFSQGTMPFRYLRVPLSTKRVTIVQCQPLIDKIMGRIQKWTSRFLSYAGRVQLIRVVCHSLCKCSGRRCLSYKKSDQMH